MSQNLTKFLQNICQHIYTKIEKKNDVLGCTKKFKLGNSLSSLGGVKAKHRGISSLYILYITSSNRNTKNIKPSSFTTRLNKILW